MKKDTGEHCTRTLTFYFSISNLQTELRWRAGEASFSPGTLVASLAVFVANRFENIVNEHLNRIQVLFQVGLDNVVFKTRFEDGRKQS